MEGLVLLRKILMKMMMVEEKQVIVLFGKKTSAKKASSKKIREKKVTTIFIYANPDVIKEKYNVATIMILLTKTFSESKENNEEEDKFKVYYFKSNETIQYFLSENPKGRLLNKPTSIEMNSCDKPYYYILNYHSYEGKRIFHLENVF